MGRRWVVVSVLGALAAVILVAASPSSSQAVPPVGTILAYAGTVPPKGYLLCDGAAYSKSSYADLSSLLGRTFCTNAAPYPCSASQFRVPDLRGRTVIGAGLSVTLETNRPYGELLGQEKVKLTIPMHRNPHSLAFTQTH